MTWFLRECRAAREDLHSLTVGCSLTPVPRGELRRPAGGGSRRGAVYPLAQRCCPWRREAADSRLSAAGETLKKQL